MAQGYLNGHGRAPTGRGVDHEAGPESGRTRRQASKPVAFSDLVTDEAPSIVRDGQVQRSPGNSQDDDRLLTARMLHEVVHALFEDQEQLPPDVGPQGAENAALWCSELEVDVRRRQHVAGEAAHPSDEILQPIVLRTDRPHDDAHVVHQLACRIAHRLQCGTHGLIDAIELAGRDVGQDRDAGETRADVVVQIRGDSRPDAFNREKLPQPDSVCRVSDSP